jgi:hypothetical protein
MFSPELEEDVTPYRNSNQWGPTDFHVIYDAEKICGMLGHGGRPFPHFGFSMAAEIREDQAISRREFFRDRHPEFVVCGKRVKKDDCGTITKDSVSNLGIPAFDVLHARD